MAMICMLEARNVIHEVGIESSLEFCNPHVYTTLIHFVMASDLQCTNQW